MLNTKVRELELKDQENLNIIKELRQKIDVFMLEQHENNDRFLVMNSAQGKNNNNFVSDNLQSKPSSTHQYEEELNRQKVGYERQIAKLKE